MHVIFLLTLHKSLFTFLFIYRESKNHEVQRMIPHLFPWKYLGTEVISVQVLSINTDISEVAKYISMA